MLVLFHLIDLLSLKGCQDFHDDIHKLMLMLWKVKGVPFRRSLVMMWESRRISHALCFSTISKTFVSNHCGDFCKRKSWEDCMGESKLLLMSFQQDFAHSYFQEKNSHLKIVEEAALCLTKSVGKHIQPDCFSAGYLYFLLGEMLISNGRLPEALYVARKAFQLRACNMLKYCEGTKLKLGEYDESGLATLEFFSPSVQQSSSVATLLLSCAATSWDFKDCVLTPSKVLECYLESVLKLGTLYEMMGYVTEAKHCLEEGKKISFAQDLPFFLVAFSVILGKIFLKEESLDLAKDVLESALSILNNFNACLECKLLFKVACNQHLGHLHSKQGKKGLAKRYSKSALDDLKFTWKHLEATTEVQYWKPVSFGKVSDSLICLWI